MSIDDNTGRAELDQLGARWSPDFDAYAAGQVPAHEVRCVLCSAAPCACPPFGTDEYFALVEQRHGRRSTPGADGTRS
jgi:hypothetical protein